MLTYKNILLGILLLCLLTVTPAISTKTKIKRLSQIDQQIPYQCSKNKQQVFDDTLPYDSSWAYKVTSGALTLNSIEVMDNIFSDRYRTWEDILNQNKQYIGEIVEYNLEILIPLILCLLLFPFLCCCCICPDTCSCCTSLRVSESKPKIGALILSFIGIVLIGAVIIFPLISPSAQQLYQAASCGLGIVINTLTNGTQTHNHKFIGANGISDVTSELGQIQNIMLSNLQSISSNGSITQNLNQNIQIFSNELKNIPYNLDGTPFSLKYPSPINSSSPITQIRSLFPQILGSIQVSDSLLGYTYSILTSLNSSWVEIVKDIDSSLLEFNQYQQTIDQVNKTIHEKVNYSIENVDSALQTGFTNVRNNIIPIFNVSYYGFLSFIGILGAIIIVCGLLLVTTLKSSLRYFIYCACAFLPIMAIIVAVIGVSFSVSTLILYTQCQYYGQNLDSQQFFSQHISQTKFGLNSSYSVCIANGNGNLTQAGILNLGNITEWAAQKDKLQDQFAQYDIPQYINETLINYYEFITQIQNIRTSKTIDIDSNADIILLDKISNATNYPQCNDQGFREDSWVPSINQVYQAIQCKVQGDYADKNSCSGRKQLQDRDQGCRGCIDTFQLLQPYNQTQVLSILEVRYQNCPQFSQQMANIWANFYEPKDSKIIPIKNKVIGVNSTIQQLVKEVQNIDQAFIQTLSKIDETFDIILNPETGLLTSLNCRPVGDSAKIGVDMLCTSYLPFFFNMKIFMTILLWTFLFLMILSVYVGNNAYKYSKVPIEYLLTQSQRSINPNQYGIKYMRLT